MRFVVLSPAADADVSAGFDVRLGPLAFVCLAGPAGEQLGEALEAVGAVLTPAEPRPRPLKLSLPVRGPSRDADPRASGYRLRRQLRQMFENPRWRLQGLYLHWQADPELDGWLLVGGADLEENDAGVTFGEWTLELSDCYVVGRPGTHRLGRRLELVDRRTGLAPLDSRGVLYSTDRAAQALPARPLVVPGDVASVLLTRNRLPASAAVGPLRGVRRLWRELDAQDGDVASFLPDDAVLPDPGRQYLDLEDVGAVRVWDTSSSTVNIGDPANWSTERDTTPELMGWERVFGPSLFEREPQLAIDNGAARVVWLGRGNSAGLALEYWDDAVGHFVRLGRLAGALDVREVTLVEVTPDRVIVEWRGAERALRVILQRGWFGPRVEGYSDAAGGTARLEYVPDAGAPALGADVPAWVDTIAAGGKTLRWARGTDDDVQAAFAVAGTFLNGAGVAYSSGPGAPSVVVAQLGTPFGPATTAELAALSVADARSIPVLVTR